MADPNLSQLAASTWDGLVTKKPMDNIFGALKLAKAIQSGGGMVERTSTPGGKTFEYTVEYAINTTARAYGEFTLGARYKKVRSEWFHEVFRKDYTPYRQHEVDLSIQHLDSLLKDWGVPTTYGAIIKADWHGRA